MSISACLTELRACHASDDLVTWHLKAVTRLLLDAFWRDLDFVHDLGMSSEDRAIASDALSGFVGAIGSNLQANRAQKYLDYLSDISYYFGSWAKDVPGHRQLGYWKLRRLRYCLKRVARLVVKNAHIASHTRMEDLQSAFQHLEGLVRRSPSTFYHLGQAFEALSELAQDSPITIDRQALGPITRVVSASVPLYLLLQRDFDAIFKLSPAAFEDLVGERLVKAGFEVRQIGKTNSPDGGIDFIATPRESVFPFLLAVQVKHHRDPKFNTGPGAVKDMQSVLAALPFHAGMIVTNTSFTPDAEWWASQSPGKLQLHDIGSLRDWVEGRFDMNRFQNIPRSIQLTPRVSVEVW